MKFPDNRALDLAREFNEQNRRLRLSGLEDIHHQRAADFGRMLDSATTGFATRELSRLVMPDTSRNAVSSIIEMTRAANVSALDVFGDLSRHAKAAADFGVISA